MPKKGFKGSSMAALPDTAEYMPCPHDAKVTADDGICQEYFIFFIFVPCLGSRFWVFLLWRPSLALFGVAFPKLL